MLCYVENNWMCFSRQSLWGVLKFIQMDSTFHCFFSSSWINSLGLVHFQTKKAKVISHHRFVFSIFIQITIHQIASAWHQNEPAAKQKNILVGRRNFIKFTQQHQLCVYWTAFFKAFFFFQLFMFMLWKSLLSFVLTSRFVRHNPLKLRCL